MPHDRVRATGVGDVAPEPGVVDRRLDPPRVPEPDVVGERPRQHTRHLRDVGHLAGPQERLGVLDLHVVPPHAAAVVDQPGQGAQQARLAGADLSQEQHQLAGLDREVDADGPPRAVLVDGLHAAQLEPLQRHPLGRRRSRCRARDEVDPVGHVHQVSPTREGSGRHLPRPGAGRLGDHRARDPTEPVEAVDRRGHQQRGRQTPAAEEVGRPRGHDAALHHHDRHAVEDRLHAVLEDRRLHPPTVDVAQVAVHVRRRRGELDRASRLQGGDQGPPESGARRRGLGGRTTRDGTTDRRGERRAYHHGQQHSPGEEAPSGDGGHGHDDQTDAEVDPAVGVAGEAVGIHGPRDHLARGRARQAVLLGLPQQHRHPGAEQDRDPPAWIAPDRRGQHQRGEQQADDEGHRQGPRRAAALQVLHQTSPHETGDGAEGAEQRRGHEERDRQHAPLGVDQQRAGDAPGQARGRRDLGVRRRRTRAAGPAHLVAGGGGSLVVVGRHLDLLAGLQQRPEGPLDHGEHRAVALLHDRARLEHRHRVRPGRRGEPVGDEDAGAAGEQAVGGADDERLGERVHPRGRLVEHDDRHLAHQEPGEGDQLLLPRGQGGPARPEQGVEAVGQPGDPVGQAELGHGVEHPLAREVGEEGDVLGEGAGEDLGPLGDHAHRGAQLLQVEVEHVDPAQQDRAALGLHGARDERGQRRLTGPGAPDQRAGAPGGDGQVDVVQSEGALLVGEVEPAQLELERSLGYGAAPGRLRLGLQELTQPDDRAEARLQVGQPLGQVVDLPHERRGHEEERHQLGDRQVVGDDEGDTGDRHTGEQGVQEDTGTARDLDLELEDAVEEVVDARGQLGHPPYDVGLAEAGPQVVTTGDALLQRGRVVGPGDLLGDLAGRDLREQGAYDEHRGRAEDGEQDPGRPPRQPRDDPHRDGREDGPQHLPDLAPDEAADLPGVVVHPVQHLTDRLLGELGQRLVQRGGEQVGAQRALGPVADRRPDRATGSVEHRGTDHAQRQQPDQRLGRVLGQPAGHDRAEHGPERADRRGGQCHQRRRAPEPAQGDLTRGVLGHRTRDRPALGGGRAGLGHALVSGGHREGRYVDPPTPRI